MAVMDLIVRYGTTTNGGSLTALTNLDNSQIRDFVVAGQCYLKGMFCLGTAPIEQALDGQSATFKPQRLLMEANANLTVDVNRNYTRIPDARLEANDTLSLLARS